MLETTNQVIYHKSHILGLLQATHCTRGDRIFSERLIFSEWPAVTRLGCFDLNGALAICPLAIRSLWTTTYP